ncbi:hypothetical protein CAEBREN_10365 [Caenorhabditis brenneri]|uniref:Uncharacterized protein n=1 Tax=Caenorhabditis brenneri TaxID=135651 RepID=G0NWN0_CAEBE|nr:hypothetical protein CAEBREN_10365 [Caenorhabditis brenneri]
MMQRGTETVWDQRNRGNKERGSWLVAGANTPKPTENEKEGTRGGVNSTEWKEWGGLTGNPQPGTHHHHTAFDQPQHHTMTICVRDAAAAQRSTEQTDRPVSGRSEDNPDRRGHCSRTA